MCRWIAYAGEPLVPHKLLFATRNSLIRQSLSAQLGMTPTNGDGFGLAWYGRMPRPGQYRDIMPAWNDSNLRSISEQIEARLLFAHVRASTGTATTRLNCHPFVAGPWMFMHNGRIGGYAQVRRPLEALLSDDLFAHRQGSTDSELMFLLILHFLAQGGDLASAFRRMVETVLETMEAAGLREVFRMSAALSDGETLHAARFSSDAASPSLFWNQGSRIDVLDGAVISRPGKGAALILSEPLDGLSDHWHAVTENRLISIRGMDFAERALL